MFRTLSSDLEIKGSLFGFADYLWVARKIILKGGGPD